MTKEQFLYELEQLLIRYCNSNNEDYTNVCETKEIKRIKTDKEHEYVRVAIGTYLIRREF